MDSKLSASPGDGTGARGRLLRFAVVGGIGFVIDATILWTGVNAFGWDPFNSRALSFSIAVLATWLLNRWMTFPDRDRARTLMGEWTRYVAAQIGGAFANLLAYSAVLMGVGYAKAFVLPALAIGAVFGLLVNYTFARLWVFRS